MTTPDESVTVSETTPVPVNQGTIEPTSEIGQILRFALEMKVPVDTIERLVALKERGEARVAAAAFNRALADFQAECPPIEKTSEAKITSTKSGGQYSYRYAELDQIAIVTRPLLTRHGLSYSWDMDLQGNKLACTCTLRHVDGHSQTAKFATITDTSSPMTDQQKVAAALTFARRQSLVQVLGLTMTDPDTDGASDEKITQQQALEIEDLIQDSGADRARFYKYMRIDSVESLRARDYHAARTSLLAKKQKGGAS